MVGPPHTQYNNTLANLNELLLTIDQPAAAANSEDDTEKRFSCPMFDDPAVMSKLVARQGSVSGFVDKSVLTCGGYILKDKSYTDICQQFTQDGVVSWEDGRRNLLLKALQALWYYY